MSLIVQEDRRAKQGVWLFLASLGVFFFSSMILFVVYVAMRVGHPGPDTKAFTLPQSFILSTILLLGISGCLHYAVLAAKNNQSKAVLTMTCVSMLMAILFFALQGEAMYALMSRALAAQSANFSPYPLTFLLAMVHALHVVGGVVALVAVIFGAINKSYDHERHWGLMFCTMYWHFLDFVWICMMVCFVVAVAIIQRAQG
jgi:cytochrome c oxidase subunit 3